MPISLRSIEAATGGALIGTCLFGAIGFSGGHAPEGATAGFALGAIVGFLAYRGRIHRVTVGAVLYAIFACLFGPAVDDHGRISAIFFAPIGAFAGWLGWRYLLALPAAFVGAVAALYVAPNNYVHPQSAVWAMAGFPLGGWLGIYVGAKLERHFDAVGGVSLESTLFDDKT